MLSGKFNWGIAQEQVADTYSAEQYINRLYFENEYLYRERQTFTVGAGFTKPSRKEAADAEKYAYARQYVRETPESCQKGRHLVVAQEYTSLDNQYANGFIHRRIKLYQARGLQVEVMAFGKRLKKDVYIYDGVNVLSGYYDELLGLLALRDYDSISVHFMNPDMWRALKANVDKETPFLIYSHGYEVRNWTRMPYQIKNRKDLDDSIERNLRNRDVWNEMYEAKNVVSKFVFVSEWWKRAVSQDVMIPFDDQRTTVIHNVIDTDMFPYVEKEATQRFNLLWIRNASKWNYGADLAARVLSELKQSKYWSSISATIVGDGEYFEYFNEFEKDANVRLHRGYLSHQQISDLHKTHGIFIVPSRWDTQGVSRDEAMSSGLVPMTNLVDAIPEFVDDTCAILGKEESFEAWLGGLIKVLEDPDKFSKMSKAAASHVRALSSPPFTVDEEIKLMKGNI